VAWRSVPVFTFTAAMNWPVTSRVRFFLSDYVRRVAAFLGCIECMRCRMLLPMCAVSVCQSVRQSVCLSRRSTRLHCAKTAEEVKNQDPVWGEHFWGPRNIVLDGGTDPPQ